MGLKYSAQICSEDILIIESKKSPLHKKFKVDDKPVRKDIADVNYQPDNYIYQVLASKKDSVI